MEIWLVIALVVVGLLGGMGTGYLTATLRFVRKQGEQAAQLSAAEARSALLESNLSELREREAEKEDVLLALAPVRSSLDRVGEQVAQLERDRSTQYGALKQQLELSAVGTEALRRAAAGVTSALNSNSARGTWGELQLRRVLEAAGMLRHVDFAEQETLGTGKRPDVLVKLPGGRVIPIDAKVPLGKHLEAESVDPAAPGAAERVAALREGHAKAVRSHVDELVRRNYHVTAGSDITVMFLPAESLLSAALEQDPALLEYALRKGVAPAAPATLFALLRAVGNVWVREELTDQADELLRIGRTLYERLGTVARHVTTLGNSIAGTVSAYNKAVASIESRLLVTARQFEPLEAPSLSAIDSDRAQVRRFTAAELAG
ncbi:MAG TPA: DNA recombination protein RmuC [Actinomycetaceae bacterium]|nr:DNA recombination protein RmuC [Actinomycetaceae bacterium]